MFPALLCVLLFVPSPTALPDPETEGGMGLSQAMAHRRSIRSFEDSDSLSLSQVSQLLWAAQGATHPRGLRTAPSAGATYPLELLLMADRVSGLEPGVYRYDPDRHRLIQVFRREGLARELAAACLGQSWMAAAPATLIIAADYPRTTGFYGDRGIRYVDMEAGHAGQNIYLQATALGLGTCAVGAFRDSEVSGLLRLERLTPLYIFPVGTPK